MILSSTRFPLASSALSRMAEFPAVYRYWNFERSVKRKAQYVHDDEVRSFLKNVMETSELGRKTLQEGQILCRAERGFEWRRITKRSRYRSNSIKRTIHTSWRSIIRKSLSPLPNRKMGRPPSKLSSVDF
jgi:hypothetical protein